MNLPTMTDTSTVNGSVKLAEFKTLEQFIIERQETFPHSTGQFSQVLRDIGLVSKIVSRDMRRAGLIDILGETGEKNIHGERQQKLDVAAHQQFVRALRRGEACGMIGSEEQEAPTLIPSAESEHGKYIVLLDPLDGSGNIDIDATVATIFSIYQKPETTSRLNASHALQPGVEQVGAGYVIYGSSTMLVYTTGSGVNGFTLDPSIGEFLLSHPDIQIPQHAHTYAVNEGQRQRWATGVRRFVDWMQEHNPEENRPFKARYSGALVADVHRILLKGGIYMYPSTPERPMGKLRLMYEANPLGFVVEQARGLASNGRDRILDMQPTSLHQYTPLYIGSADLVERAEGFVVSDYQMDISE